MIQFLNYENNRIIYKSDSPEIIPIRIEVYDNYTNSFMFSNELDLNPTVEFFTYIPFVWNIVEVYIYDRRNNEILCHHRIKGGKKLNEYDEYGYIQKLFQIEKNKVLQGSLNQVVGEHFFMREYINVFDIEEGDVVVDVGFNYGIFSLFALYNKASKIYGFEPNIDIYNTIKNIYPEPDRVEIYNYAVSDKNKKMTFYSTPDTVASTMSFSKDGCKEYEVQCINLSDFIIEYNIEKIDFLKIDCEGEEYNVNIIINKLEKNNFTWRFSHNVDYNSDVGLIYAQKNVNI
jgi:FkbM family methyltransferase